MTISGSFHGATGQACHGDRRPRLAASLLGQEPFVIAAGAIRACEVPIRTVATSVSILLSLFRPLAAETYFYSTRLQQSSSNR